MAPAPHPPSRREIDPVPARGVVHPVRRFLDLETAGGIVLLGATVLAVAWASSPWSGGYHGLWTTDAHLTIGGWTGGADLRHVVDDGLMALFFFVIGMEVKQELTTGRLSDRRAALVPVAGALGGMALPALLYAACNLGGAGAGGWAIPMATDVAFALGVLALLGDRVPAELTAILLGLAIVDDIGAVAVIALVLGDGVSLPWLAAAAAGLAAVAGLLRTGVRAPALYVGLGLAVWTATLASGVHATLAGVALGLLVPARTGPDQREAATERLQRRLHPWTAFAVVPAFALANAGVALSGSTLRDAAGSAVTLGVVLGLVAGKSLGVAGAIWLACRVGVARLPDGIRQRHVLGMASVAGIGFTVSLFIAQLAFDDPAAVEQATIGILVGSLLAAALGTSVLRRTLPRPTPSPRGVDRTAAA